ncbi:hypothetical protein [Pontivivens ytuae]|uniref:Uncharacterized protein n=1 Tax=Pontivivens ytuae TaxID=2789856 RepID=A0A7S9QEX2_9RHOB|nr:hypothetical protein [Pontivivens ytuae]QPH55656.1 hypothetical protein I0K15_07990 [Pontivivens ytuae]
MRTMADPCSGDRLTTLIEAALLAAREARIALQDRVLPHLPPARRLAGARVLRMIERRELFTDRFRDDLDHLLGQIDGRIAAGSFRCWEPKPDDLPGGSWQIIRSPEAEMLVAASVPIRALDAALCAVRAAREAQSVAFDLIQPN